MKELFSFPFEWKEIMNQCYQIGYRSLPLISLTSFITGIVFTKQSRPSLASFGATSWLPLLDITGNVKSISHKIDTGNGTAASLINDPFISLELKKILTNLDQTISNFKVISVNGSHVAENLNRLSRNFNSAGNSINRVANDSDFYPGLLESVGQLKAATASLETMTKRLDNSSQKMNENSSEMGVLLSDTSSARSLAIMIKNLESGSVKLNDDLEAVQHNFLLKGFFKKKNKQ